jgi:hypothetical protein
MISDNYRQLQSDLHNNPDYGVASVFYAKQVAEIVSSAGVTEILDYGAGKGRLGQELKKYIDRPLSIRHYDPAILEWSEMPQPCEMTTCIDVLEHVEPDFLIAVLDHLRSLTIRYGFFTVHTGPAIKFLADGRNAHLIQKPSSWWLPLIIERFELIQFARGSQGFAVLVKRAK